MLRLTNNLMTRNYLNNLNKSLSDLNDLSQSMTDGRKYEYGYQDPSTAAQAFKVRQDLTRNSLYQDNITAVTGQMTEAETIVSQLNDQIGDALTQVQQGSTGTMSADNRKIIASTLRSIQNQILSLVNSKYSGKYMFGGSNVNDQPFTVDASGKLLYNGQSVDTGTFTNDVRYVDVGLGLATDASGNVVPGTAYDTAISGNSLLGTGVDGSGISNNLYNLIGQIATAFENNDMTNISAYQTKLNAKKSDVMLQYVNIGDKGKFLEFLTSRFESQETNLKSKQKDLEGVDTAKAITDFKEQEMVYNAALQMGVKILQPSLLDYLR
jgi:Flagellin and related hook-associated proteins